MPDIRAAKQVLQDTNEQRICLNCGQKKLTKDFYDHLQYKEGQYKDLWCKQCVGKIKNKYQMRKYFWQNKRKWDQRIWESCVTKATKLVSANATYQRSSDDRKAILLERIAAQQIASMVNKYYKYEDTSCGGKYSSFEQAIQNGLVVQEQDPNERKFNAQWNGKFTKHELQFLQNKYSELNRDFKLDDASTQDYARKVCKASLHADSAMSDYMSGKCGFEAVKDANNVFDILSKSANFAACKRKSGDTSGLTSFGEFVAKWEASGISPQEYERPVIFAQDAIDRCTKNLYHLAASLNLDNA